MSNRNIEALVKLSESLIRFQHIQDIGTKVFNADDSATPEMRDDLKKQAEEAIKSISAWKELI